MHEADKHSHVITVVIMCAASYQSHVCHQGHIHMQNRHGIFSVLLFLDQYLHWF